MAFTIVVAELWVGVGLGVVGTIALLVAFGFAVKKHKETLDKS